MSLDPLARWRLVLGEAADGALGGALDPTARRMDAALDWLYGREGDASGRNLGGRSGGSGPSQLTVPAWLDEVHTLFPRETIERLERDAVERYAIDDVVTRPEVLARLVPNETLLRAVLRTKHLMNPEVLRLARSIVAEVVRQLLERLARQVRAAFSGTLDRRRHSPVAIARNLDFRTTIAKSLHRYQPAHRRVVIERPYFFSRVRRHTDRWQVVILVDQSGSMAGSVIHAAVTAACLWSLPALRTHLVAFDTDVVDHTLSVGDPVELLLRVQLGGGTDIAKALAYGSQLIETPRRAIVVLITDFFEGGDPRALFATARALIQQGTHVLGLAALDERANPVYDRDVAGQLVALGCHVGAMTPGELAAWIAAKVGA